MANQQVMKSLTYAYRGRRLKKRDFRRLWITRISAACKMNGMNYSTFMHGLKRGELDGLADLANFGGKLEEACFDTLNAGVMTKDLVGLVEPGFEARARGLRRRQ